MEITDKTRKLLWGKSGSRCAMCRHVLYVDATPNDDESIVGEECHIISKKENGPRFDPTYSKDKLDSYENLILLCLIHHKQVDDQDTTYTAEILKGIKVNHEKWVSKQLDKESMGMAEMQIKRIPQNIPKYLQLITKGKEIFNIVEGAHTFQIDNDELLSEEEVESVGEFLDIVKDWGDIGPDLEPSSKVSASFRLTSLIQELEAIGFWVFGAREQQKLVIDGHVSSWEMAIVNVIRKTSPLILKIDVSNNSAQSKVLKSKDK